MHAESGGLREGRRRTTMDAQGLATSAALRFASSSSSVQKQR